MFEKSEQFAGENEHMKNTTDAGIPVIEGINQSEAEDDKTHKLSSIQKIELPPVIETPLPPPEVYTKKAPVKKLQPPTFSKRDKATAHMLQERCRHLCLSLFFRENAPVRSLGFTSSINGEGKSFLALLTARVLAHDSNEPVTFVECNWEHPSLHEQLDIPATPGLAEWLRGSCDEDDIRYQIDDNLTVIPAGNGSQDAVKLLKRIQQKGLLNTFKHSNELFIFELPPIITTGYGSLAASLLEAIVIVVRTRVIPDRMIEETCAQMKDLPVHGIILNQNESRIPGWIRQMI